VSEPWVWLEELSSSGSITLMPDEARHVAARRLRVGDSLAVFDGHGHRAAARIESLGKNSTVVAVDSIEEVARPGSEFILASAIPKGDRLSSMLQMLSQLGLESWQPLVLEDSAIRKLDPKSKRLVRILVESCKVAKRPWLLDVREPCSLEEALSGRPFRSPIYFGDREGGASGFEASAGLVLIGPEAGFSESERKLLRGVDAQARSFGTHNLRIETAAVAAAVALHFARSRDPRRE
jgi:16S rRNA (uracil1498-N3)-methyltransferase